MGFAIGPIPWRDIILYADRSGLDPDVAEAFVVIIKSMDIGYLEWQADEIKRSEGSGGKYKGR